MEKFQCFTNIFCNIPDCLNWKNDKIFLRNEKEVSVEEINNFKLFAKNYFSFDSSYDFFFNKSLKRLKNAGIKPNQFIENIIKNDLNDLPLFDKIILSTLGYKENLKSRILQFIYEVIKILTYFYYFFIKNLI